LLETLREHGIVADPYPPAEAEEELAEAE
jgi:hypothetical protein